MSFFLGFVSTCVFGCVIAAVIDLAIRIMNFDDSKMG